MLPNGPAEARKRSDVVQRASPYSCIGLPKATAMIASLSAGLFSMPPAGVPCPPPARLWLPARAGARGAAGRSRRLPPLRSGPAGIPPLRRPTTPAAVAAVRAARRAAGLRALWAPGHRHETYAAEVKRARAAARRAKDALAARRRRRTPPRRTPPAPPRVLQRREDDRASETSAPPPRKLLRTALPPKPPPKPCDVDASLGTYGEDAALVAVQRRDVLMNGASLQFCARAGDAACAVLGRAMGTRLWPASNVMVQYLDTLCLTDQRVLELGAGAGLCGLYAQRARKCGALVLTDHDASSLKLLRHNVALNDGGHVHGLDWHSATDLSAVLALHGSFSTILASDVLFRAKDLGAFYKCANTLLEANGRLVVAFEDRVAGLEEKVLAEAKRAGFAARAVPLSAFFDPARDVVDGDAGDARLFGETVLPGNGSWASVRLWEMSRRPTCHINS